MRVRRSMKRIVHTPILALLALSLCNLPELADAMSFGAVRHGVRAKNLPGRPALGARETQSSTERYRESGDSRRTA